MVKKLVCLAAVCLTLAVAGSAGAQVGKGKVLWEYWYGAPVNDNLDNLKADPRFPNSPSEAEWRDGLDRPDVASRDNWGGRGRAFLTPAQTGDYTFWTASDDDSELWLSTDESPANAVKIANVEGWCNYQNWTGPGESPGPNRQSAPIPLVAGKTYYVELLFSDGTGGGHVSVGWAGPGLGNTPTVLKGDVLTALIRDPEPLFQAQNPDPANGAVEVTSPLFQWTPGPTAVMHEVYMGTNPTPGAAEFMGPWPTNMYFHIPGLTAGVTYYWRVDEVDATGAKYAGNVWSFTAQPLEAHFPVPADQATNIRTAGQLKWTAGQGALGHMVYLGTDKAAVETGAASVQVSAGPDTQYDYAGLNGFTTYYWRVDEVSSTGQMVAGPVWSFSTVSYLPMNDAAVTLNYDNSAAPFVSQVELTGPTDWTANGVSDLTLQFTGRRVSFVQTADGITMTASGADIYNLTDEFRYAYKKLSGDGSITVRVDRLDVTNAWAKAGVMIRESLAPVVKSVHTIVSGSNGFEFQYRPAAGGNTTQFNTSGGTPALPRWLRLTRQGNTFTGETSSDGTTWAPITVGASTAVQVLEMPADVYIGLAVTSHVAGTITTAQFSQVETTGGVSGDWQVTTVAGNHPGNSPADLYAAVEDATGKVAVVQFGDPAATNITQAWTWKIRLSAFAGVDLKNVAKLYLGAGDMLNPAPGGSGVVTFNNVRVIRPVVLTKGADVTAPGDNVLGVPNNGNWPAAEAPWLAIDDKAGTKFLHFSGKTEPVGFQVQVLAGPSLVTGLTLTTANDAAERDPVGFELSGSNDGFAGPWTLIAGGPIVDFNDPAAAWPRLTKGTTAITFGNKVAYKFYQVLFTPVRNPTAANSMQIAEVELINGGPHVMWVSDAYDDDKDGVRDDQGWIDLLTSQGFNVEYRMNVMGNGYWRTLDQAKLDALNAADLVISSRNFNSGDYTTGDEETQWNSVTTPLIGMSMHVVRSTHWKWFNTTTIPNAVPVMKPVDPASPAFAGVTLDANGQVEAVVAGMNTSFPGIKDAGNGTVIATRADTGDVWIAKWEAGTEFYPGAGQIAAGPRVFFAAGAQEVPASGIGRGELNFTDSGLAVFLNVIDLLLP
jgi:hypothetical protein